MARWVAGMAAALIAFGGLGIGTSASATSSVPTTPRVTAHWYCTRRGLITVITNYHAVQTGVVHEEITWKRAYPEGPIFKEEFHVKAGDQVAFERTPPLDYASDPATHGVMTFTQHGVTITRTLGSFDAQKCHALHHGDVEQRVPSAGPNGLGPLPQVRWTSEELTPDRFGWIVHLDVQNMPAGERPKLTYCSPYYSFQGLAACDRGVRVEVDAQGHASIDTYWSEHFTGERNDSIYCGRGSGCFFLVIADPGGHPDPSFAAKAQY